MSAAANAATRRPRQLRHLQSSRGMALTARDDVEEELPLRAQQQQHDRADPKPVPNASIAPTTTGKIIGAGKLAAF